MRFPRRRHAWLLGRRAAKALLRQVIPGQPDPAEIQIENEPGGAPFASISGQRLAGCLTISHRANFGLAAYTAHPAMQIGADLELVEPGSPDFLNDYLSPVELEIAARLPESERSRWMFLAWSAKEAVLKALRIGLRADTRSVELLAPAAAQPGQWTPLCARTSLPGAQDLRLWWQTRDNLVLTLAVIQSMDALQFHGLDADLPA
jgi:4'-phosphopantetheinyl transferase